ncbi:DNA-directed RNA polymerase II subunit RPB1-like [Anopheles stephensi]|uniref:DNA-directed RNA polymerase II subunit RPB1-like n=1 Tax=Anopheles stephensi TaxID=30069 RepID=UPI001658BC8F|nr:DNA-directed RNA polymerase II subunit RPB1-like [Anopheles stephensi]
MKLKYYAILFAFFAAFVEGNEIRCFSCDDCLKQAPTIVECNAKNGLDLNAFSYNPTYPILTPSTPAWNTNPWDPILTPPTLPPNGNQNNPWDPLLTPPPVVGGDNNGGAWYPGNPIITPPPLYGNGGNGNQLNPWDPQLTPPPPVGGNTAWNPGNPILTPPTTYYPFGQAKGHLKPQKRFVCATIRSKGKDSQKDTIHRRGCAEIEGYAIGVCDQGQIPVTEGGITSCRVCGHSLCNE